MRERLSGHCSEYQKQKKITKIDQSHREPKYFWTKLAVRFSDNSISLHWLLLNLINKIE